jgi:hypothetical protein
VLAALLLLLGFFAHCCSVALGVASLLSIDILSNFSQFGV